jgi:hypothetical protein
MKKIALICAKPFENNPGMLSVDLAFDKIRNMISVPISLSRFCLRGSPPIELDKQGVELSYKNIEDNFDEILNSDLILFWGDFSHSIQYYLNDILPDLQTSHPTSKPITLLRSIFNYLLLNNAPKKCLNKSISFGTSLAGVDHSLLCNFPLYAKSLTRFIHLSHATFFRDSYSSNLASLITSFSNLDHVGMDCSLLLNKNDYLKFSNIKSVHHTHKKCFIYFNRTKGFDLEVQSFTQRLCHQLKVEFEWLPWLECRPENLYSLRKRFSSLNLPDYNLPYGSLISKLLSASYVITDTYHLSLISRRLGIPTLCFGSGAQDPTQTTSDKKKEYVHQMYGCGNLYLFVEMLKDPLSFKSALTRSSNLLTNQELTSKITTSIDHHSKRTEARLVKKIEEVLS